MSTDYKCLTKAYVWLMLFHMTVHTNHYHSLGHFSRWQSDDIFLLFQKIGFAISCKLSPQETVYMNVKPCLLGKIWKIFQTIVCCIFLSSMLSIQSSVQLVQPCILTMAFIVWARNDCLKIKTKKKKKKKMNLPCLSLIYRIPPNYHTYPYKRTVKQFHSLQITAS